MMVLSEIGNHLWQSTAFAGGAALLALALRRNDAALRHRIWAAASLKFLIPLAPLIDLGARFEWKTAEAVAAPVSSVVRQVGQPFADAAAVANPIPRSDETWLLALFAAIWACGFLLVTVRWWSRWRVAGAARRGATILPITAPVPVLSSDSRLEPGVFGVLRPVLLLPVGIEARLSPDQLRAVLAHELCHVRRRDNLWASAQMAVEALFWFHPLVWWIGARMVDERERACDEEVVRLGNDPEAYASGILDVCRFYLETPLPCASGVTGADLEKRIGNILNGTALLRLNTARKALIGAAATLAIAAPIAVGLLRAETLRFEVASIKRNKREGMKGSMELLPGGGLRMGGATVKGLIALAYDLREEQIVGGPKWLDQETYNILAKAERAEAAATPAGPGSASWDRLRARLQTLLAERCRLAVRRDAKATPGYALVPAKGGAKLTPATNPLPPGTVRSRGAINGRSGTMHMLAAVLTHYVGRPVVDRTGLTESYDYKLEYADEGEPDATVDESASLFTALQEQLGLKLEATRVSLETIVIERVEKPSDN
jgi:uncharacterized protein (TIGR03435 family)